MTTDEQIKDELLTPQTASNSSNVSCCSGRDLVAEARELAEKATPGEWAWEWAHPGYLLMQQDPNDAIKHLKCVLDGASDDNQDFNIIGDQHDLRFIARSRSLVPELADALEAALVQLAHAKEARQEFESMAYDTITGRNELKERLEKAEAVCESVSDILAGANSVQDQIAIIRRMKKQIESWRSSLREAP